MNDQLRRGVQTGFVFGIIVTFLFLIGFTDTAAALLGNTLQDNTLQPGFGLTTKMMNLLLFLGLLGLWAGIRASRTDTGKSAGLVQALGAGAVAGLVHGLMVGGLAYLVGTLNEAGVRMSRYLAQVLPDAIQLFLLGKA